MNELQSNYTSFDVANEFSEYEDFNSISDKFYCENGANIKFGTLDEIRKNTSEFCTNLLLVKAPFNFEVEQYKNRKKK